MTVLGAVLAGGRSSRFGTDKAAALFDGMALAEHVAAALSPHVAEVVMVRAADDRPTMGLGPLGGLAGALHLAAAKGHDRVLLAPCDAPLLPAALLVRLAAAEEAVFVAGLPVLGGWPAALGPALERHLAEGGERSMRGWARSCGAPAIEWAAIPNVNTVGELASLGRFAE